MAPLQNVEVGVGSPCEGRGAGLHPLAFHPGNLWGTLWGPFDLEDRAWGQGNRVWES